MQLSEPQGVESALREEVALVQAASRGDSQAFADLYERYLDRVFRYVYYRIGNHHEAEDLTEQVFLKAWRAMPSYQDRGIPFCAWLYRLSHNLLVDRHRAHHQVDSLDEAYDIADEGTTPEEESVRREEARELTAALGRLSPIEQHVVTLRFVAGLDHHTVAAIIGKTDVATRSIQSRALARLARLLKTPGRSE